MAIATTQNSAAEFELTEGRIPALMRSARSCRARVILALLYFCGLRRFEACAVDVPDIDFSNHWRVIRSGKGAKSRVVPLGKIWQTASGHLSGGSSDARY